MSAFVNPPATPAPAPERVTPQPVRPAPKQPFWRSRWLALVLIVVAAVGAYLVRMQPARNAPVPAGLRTVKVTGGTLQKILRIAGTTSAQNFVNILTPMMRGPDAGRALVLIYIAKSGALVKKGELIAQIDAQSIKDHVDEIDALVQQAEADVRKRKAEQAIEEENLRQSLRAAKADLDKARLDNSAAAIRTSIDQELLTLSVAEAEAQYKELQAELATTEIAHKAEIRILELTRDRHARHRDRHKVDVTKFTMYAPMSGLVVMQTVWRGGERGQVQQGDQVAPGQPFMKIVDPSSMQVEATVNQVESEWLRLGQSAVVGFDAFPGLHLEGKVASVGAMAVGGWRQNYYIRNIPVKVDLLGQDPRVIPDLSAYASVQLEQKDQAVIVPLEAVHPEGGKFFVYVKNDDQFIPREVQLGLSNNVQAAVTSGLSSGEEIALERPPTISR